MHLKKIIKKDNKLFIQHFVDISGLGGSETYCEKLTIKNCWKYLNEILSYLCFGDLRKEEN